MVPENPLRKNNIVDMYCKENRENTHKQCGKKWS